MTIRWYIIIFIFIFTLFSVGSYTLTRAYFTDTVVSTNHTFITAESFDNLSPQEPQTTPPAPESTPSGKVVINEVFESSSNNAEWVELYNAGNENVDISGWTIADENGTDVLPLSIPLIEPGRYVVIVPSSTTITEFPEDVLVVTLSGASGNLIGNGLANSGDKVVLKSGELIIDQVSWGDNDKSLDPPALKPSAGNSLRRIPNGVDTDTASDWKVGTPSLGIENN